MPTSDDSVREIQLSGKQLVFLFMAVTVVSVVIFLCGVLVGRGVQAPASTMVDATPAAVEEPADPTAPGAVPPATGEAGPTAVPDLGYQSRLEADAPPAEKLVKPTDAPPSPAPTSTPPRAEPSAQTPGAAKAAAVTSAAPPPAPVTPAAPNPAFVEPRGEGFAIQVAALRGRSEAEAVAGRLKARGYAAFVLAALPGQPPGFRVRVGKFKARAEAEQVAAKLEREEQFKPWITR